MVRRIRNGDANLVHITVQFASGKSDLGYVRLYIKHPFIECLKRDPVFLNPLRDQALFKMQRTTLQLGQTKGATKIPTTLWSRYLQLGLLEQIKIRIQVGLDDLQKLQDRTTTQDAW